MRATGFGVGSPHDYTGEYLIPMCRPDGTNLDYNYKSITEHRREMLYTHKNKDKGEKDIK